MPIRQLKPLLVILGGIREIGPSERDEKHSSRRRTRVGMDAAVEVNVQHRLKIRYPEEKKACRRFIKNVYGRLGKVWVSTPLGHITVAEIEEELHEFREELYEYAALHNRKNEHWRILVELAWTRLDEDATSTLLALVEELPEEFWL